MKKIGDVTSTADKNGEWTNGNVAAGIAPTILEAGWLNSVQREILGVLVEAGIAQDKNNDNQLKDAIKKIISGGNYATKTEVNSKLAKDQNGADIQNKDTFIKNLGLPEKYQPKGTYADGKVFYSIGSGERGIFGSNGESFIVGNASSHTGVYKDGWVWMFNASGVMIYGDVPVARISDLNTKLFGVGQSVQNVTSQRSVGTTYKNNTGKAICVSAGGTAKATTEPVFLSLEVDGYLMATSKTATGGGANGMSHVFVCGTVLPGSSYIVKDGTAGNDKVDLKFWTEVR
ncbi:TPA: hypothetical protein ACRRX3_002788 [Morganella morganii]